MNKSIFLLLGVGLLTLLAACGSSPSTPTAAPAQPTALPTAAKATAAPTAGATDTPLPPPTPAPQIVYQEDFTQPREGWETYHQSDGDMAVENGAYHMVVRSPTMFWVNVPLAEEPQDVLIEVDVSKRGGPEDGVFGLVCRQNPDEFTGYVFLINGKGEYGIAYNHDFTGLDWLGDKGAMQTSEAIHQGQASNHLTVACVGSTLTLAVNGEKLLEVQDERLSSGPIGFFAGNPTEPGSEVLFDNLTVAVP